LENHYELPLISDVSGWTTFMQKNPLPTQLDAKPRVVYNLLRKVKPRQLIAAHIAFKDLRRPKEKLYLSCAIYFAIAATVNKKLFESFAGDRPDFIANMTGELFAIADDVNHKHHSSFCKFFFLAVRGRTWNAAERYERKNPNMEDIDNLTTNPKNDSASLVSAPEAELWLIAKDAAKLMPTAVRKSYENLINDVEDDENITERSRYRKRAKAREILKSEIEHGFMTSFDDDDDDDLTTTNLSDPRDFCLMAFHFACPDNPSEADVTKWCEAFPQFSDTIREEAEISRKMSAEKEGPDLTEEDVRHLLETFEKKYV
jgi:hypothetical protein